MSEPTAQSFDAKAFKEEIKRDNTELIENAVQSITNNVNSTIEKFKTEAVPEDEGGDEPMDESLNKYKDEVDTLRLPADQAMALQRMIKKVVDENASGMKTDILSTVDRNISEKDQKALYSQQTLKQFPDIANPNSVLFKEAKIIYSKLSDAVKKSPDAEQIATEKAALKLGIRPLDLNSVNSFYAQNPTGGGAGDAGEDKREISADIASFFNVDQKKVNEKLKQISNK